MVGTGQIILYRQEIPQYSEKSRKRDETGREEFHPQFRGWLGGPGVGKTGRFFRGAVLAEALSRVLRVRLDDRLNPGAWEDPDPF